MIPKILVTQRLELVASYKEEREVLDVRWYQLLRKCGMLPIPVSYKVTAREYFKNFEPAGILLTGGNDLSCVNPGNVQSEKRDRFEHELIRLAIARKIPILGVCRGMQMICHFSGGRLEKRAGHAAVKHALVSVAASRFLTHMKSFRAVNSYHNFCVTRPGRGMKTIACDKDGVIEAVEHNTHNILGIMWHPERNKPFKAADVELIQDFLKQNFK